MSYPPSRAKVICAIDTSDLAEAIQIVSKVSPYAAGFKIGHALTLANGLHVIARLQDAGAEKVFLDLKFHDIPHVVGLAVKEANRFGAWMTTIHFSGGEEMMRAAADAKGDTLVVGVSALTSLSESQLQSTLGTSRSLVDHMAYLTRLGMSCGLDGAVCSVHEVPSLLEPVGKGVLVTPGIRAAGKESHDQARVADGKTAIELGSSYLVIGRALTHAADPAQAMQELGLL